MALRRIRKELDDLEANPLNHISAVTVDDNLFKLDATIKGPLITPYGGGSFGLKIIFPQDYPFKQPVTTFTTQKYIIVISMKLVV